MRPASATAMPIATCWWWGQARRVWRRHRQRHGQARAPSSATNGRLPAAVSTGCRPASRGSRPPIGPMPRRRSSPPCVRHYRLCRSRRQSRPPGAAPRSGRPLLVEAEGARHRAGVAARWSGPSCFPAMTVRGSCWPRPCAAMRGSMPCSRAGGRSSSPTTSPAMTPSPISQPPASRRPRSSSSGQRAARRREPRRRVFRSMKAPGSKARRGGRASPVSRSPLPAASPAISCAWRAGGRLRLQLYAQRQGRLRFDQTLGAHLPSDEQAPMLVAGAAAGHLTLAECLDGGWSGGTGRCRAMRVCGPARQVVRCR